MFGCSEDVKTNREQQSGKYSFLVADIVVLPAPSETSPYYSRIHCDTHISNLHENKYQYLDFTFPQGNSFAGSVNNSNAFNEAANDLPVIARNQLDNGVSQNLWYERVVPHKAIFLTGIIYPDGDSAFIEFDKYLTGNLVQVGANATVGYGLCKFTNITPTVK